MRRTLLSRLVIAAFVVLVPTLVAAQDPHAGHGQPAKPAAKPEAEKPKTTNPETAKPQTAQPQNPEPQQPAAKPQTGKPPDPHAGHGQLPAKEPATPQTAKPQPPETQPAAEDHTAHMAQASDTPKEPIPPLTDADRAAAFPPALEGHAVHDNAINYMVLFDQFEWQGRGEGGLSWDNQTWIGGDINRVWIRAEGEAEDGDIENSFVDVLWGRSITRWWDFVAGVRRDFAPGPDQTWVGAGIQGLAPYWFEIEATGYVGQGGRTHARFEAEYDLLLTNRLILQPLVEAEFYGKSDELRGLGAGLTTFEGGIRLRYEFRREIAPYVGITWDRKMFGTADLARAQGQEVAATRVAFGLRTWF